MARSVEVLVVGGGPAGAATAAALAARGREVLLIDRAAFPREKLCGDFIHPLGVAALEQLGVLPAVRPLAQSLRGMKVISPAGRVVAIPFPAGTGLSLSRTALDVLLLKAAASTGASLETGCALRHVHRRQVRWQVETDRGALRTRVLVGADGIHSMVAAGAGLGRRRPRVGRYALGLRMRGLPTTPGWAEMHLTRGGYCGVSTFPDGESNVTAVHPKTVLRRERDLLSGGPLDEAARRLLAPFPSLHARLDVATITALRAVGPLAPWKRPVVGDGVLLVGDAASFTDPLTGQGVSMALTGAVRAADVIDGALRAGDLSAPGLAAYARWHRDHARGLQGFLRLVDWLALHSPLIEPLLRAWQSHPALASRFLGVIANAEPVRGLLSPSYLSRLALACTWKA